MSSDLCHRLIKATRKGGKDLWGKTFKERKVCVTRNINRKAENKWQTCAKTKGSECAARTWWITGTANSVSN